jgi:hypothetical protein
MEKTQQERIIPVGEPRKLPPVDYELIGRTLINFFSHDVSYDKPVEFYTGPCVGEIPSNPLTTEINILPKEDSCEIGQAEFSELPNLGESWLIANPYNRM